MSSTRQAVVRGPSFTGSGKRPDLTPAHHVDLETGIGPSGPRIDLSRTKPVSGKVKQFRTKASYSKAEAGSRDLLVRRRYSWTHRACGRFGLHETEFGYGVTIARAIQTPFSATSSRYLHPALIPLKRGRR